MKYRVRKTEENFPRQEKLTMSHVTDRPNENEKCLLNFTGGLSCPEQFQQSVRDRHQNAMIRAVFQYDDFRGSGQIGLGKEEMRKWEASATERGHWGSRKEVISANPGTAVALDTKRLTVAGLSGRGIGI